MHPIFDDIEDEVRRLALEAGRLSARLERLSGEIVLPGSQEEWEASALCASAAEKIYSGCERIMARIAAAIDAAPVDHDGAWHKALLDRMSGPFAGRPAIITAATRQILDTMRAFRHRERNSYGFDLDAEIVFERARQSVEAYGLLAADVRRFFKT